jgi:DNA-binding GntR family transcriptional regulator
MANSNVYGTGTVEAVDKGKWRVRVFLGRDANRKSIRRQRAVTGSKALAYRVVDAIRQNDEKAAEAMERLLASSEQGKDGTAKGSGGLLDASADGGAGAPDPDEWPVCSEDGVIELFEGLEEGTTLTRREIASRCGIISEKKARTLMRRLADDGILVKHGETKGVRYSLRG